MNNSIWVKWLHKKYKIDVILNLEFIILELFLQIIYVDRLI